MQIERVIAGVNGDTSMQAVQLRMRASFQNQVQNSRIVAWDASGANPIVLSAPNASVTNHGVGVTVLIASANFVNATSPAALPDFVMSNLIPVSYLAAGSLTFENSTGTIVLWRLSWGGAGYAGSTTGDVTNDTDGQFGPPYPGALPSADTRALRFQGSASALSTSNLADYALTGTSPVFTNNAGQTFTVQDIASGIGSVVATRERLEQNVPNPFHPATEIAFTMDRTGYARLQVFDVRGRLVATLADRVFEAGRHQVEWRGSDAGGAALGSTVYFYRLVTESGVETRKMVLVR